MCLNENKRNKRKTNEKRKKKEERRKKQRKTMTLSAQSLGYAKVLYWVVMIMAQSFACYLLFKASHALAGLLWLFVGFFLIYVMYYVYFPAGDPGSHWPPYISACPDYLTKIGPNACVDYVGLSSPLLKRSDPLSPPPITDTTRVFDSSGSTAAKAAKTQQYGLSWEGVA